MLTEDVFSLDALMPDSMPVLMPSSMLARCVARCRLDAGSMQARCSLDASMPGLGPSGVNGWSKGQNLFKIV
jgi:hypothetical protein